MPQSTCSLVEIDSVKVKGPTRRVIELWHFGGKSWEKLVQICVMGCGHWKSTSGKGNVLLLNCSKW